MAETRGLRRPDSEVELLNAGRERARKAALEEAAFQEAKARQALNAGTQTAA